MSPLFVQRLPPLVQRPYYWYRDRGTEATTISTEAATIGTEKHRPLVQRSSFYCYRTEAASIDQYFCRLYWYRGVNVLLPGWVIFWK
jgi:hypothetical protein